MVSQADVAAILRALAGWRGLAERIEDVLRELIAEQGHVSARDFLAGSGLEQAWRPQLEQALVDQAALIVASDAFADWLGEVVAELPG